MTTLLERDTELDRLRVLLAEARSGRGRVVFVGGEAGIGKTMLVTAFVDDCAGDARVAFGRCDALVTPRALGPVLEVASNLGISPASDRDSLLGCIVEDIRQHGPTVVVIEDAHWADDATIELVVMLGRRVVDIPLLLLVTYREDEVTGRHPLRLAIGDLVTSSATTWLGLAPLTRDAVQLMADRAGLRGDELFERSGGNPFFVTEALAAPGQYIPTTVRLAVLARAARLDPASRSVLDAVSIVPGRAETWLVDDLCQPAPAAVDGCVAAGVLNAERGTYAFRHELARLAIEADLSHVARRELNQRAVASLMRRPDIDAARIAHHAEAAGDDEALGSAGRRACLLAVARTAHREAILHGERALRVRHVLSADEVAEIQTKLAPSLIALARSEEAVEAARSAAEHWQAAGDDRREAGALVVLSNAIASVGHTEASMVPLARAIELLERFEPGPELASCYLRFTSAHMLARDRDQAADWGERAIALATALGDDQLLGRALIETGIADVMDGRFGGLATVRRGIDIGRQRDFPGVVANGLSQIGSGCGEMRRYDEAVPALVEGSALSAHNHYEQLRRYQVAWLGRCRFDLGQWEEAEALARDAIGGSRTVAIARFVGLNTLGWLRARRGDADVMPLLDEALDIARDMRHLQRLWPCAVARAEAGWLDGALEPHLALLEEVMDLAILCRHGIAIGEIGVWLARAGLLAATPPGAAEPFASWIAGDHMRAAAGFRQMGCPYEAASALADSGDTPSLREALATFQRLGAAPMARIVGEQLRSRGVRVAVPANRPVAPRHPSGLSDRELEVLKLVAAGFTNPQIATSLYISRKTAEHHVSSILVKFGATSRSEAAAEAVRLGLAG